MTVDSHSDESAQWFALRVKARCEKMVATMATHKGFEAFLPVYRERRRWSDRMKAAERPLFPGYVFCRMDPQNRLPLLVIPGVLHFVGIGKTPVAVAEWEIAAIRAMSVSGLPAEPWPYLEIGHKVLLEDGPLAGVQGILVGAAKQRRVVISVTLLKRSVAVVIERHWVLPLDAPERTSVGWVRPSRIGGSFAAGGLASAVAAK